MFFCRLISFAAVLCSVPAAVLASGENEPRGSAEPDEAARACRPQREHDLRGDGEKKYAFPRNDGQRAVPPADPDDAFPPPPPGAFSKEEARLLKSLFLMSDSELRRLRGLIQHVEKMPPEKRRQMAADLERATSDMTPEQRAAYMREMRERFRKNQENLLARYYATLPPEQADAERRKFLSLSHKERRAYIFEVRKKLCCELPPPPPEHDGDAGKKPPLPPSPAD